MCKNSVDMIDYQNLTEAERTALCEMFSAYPDPDDDWVEVEPMPYDTWKQIMALPPGPMLMYSKSSEDLTEFPREQSIIPSNPGYQWKDGGKE